MSSVFSGYVIRVLAVAALLSVHWRLVMAESITDGMSKGPDFTLKVTIDGRPVIGFMELGRMFPDPQPAERKTAFDKEFDKALIPVKRGQRLYFKVGFEKAPGVFVDVTMDPDLHVDFSLQQMQRPTATEILVEPERGAPLIMRDGIIEMSVAFRLRPSGKVGYNRILFKLIPASEDFEVQGLTNNQKSNDTDRGSRPTGSAAQPQPKLSGIRELRPEIWPQLLKLPGIPVKSGPNDLTRLIVLFDPNCPPCAQLWQRLYRADSRYQTLPSLWVPVAYMRDDSLGKAAHLLTTGTREALAHNFDGFDFKARVGRAPVIDVTPSLRAAIERNKEWWQKIIPATPLILFREADGRAFYHAGAPSSSENLEALLNRLAPVRLPDFKDNHQ